MSDDHREVALRILTLADQRGQVPAEVSQVVEELRGAWTAGVPNDPMAAEAKIHLWSYLERKHGNSTTIADLADRSVRAALCLAERPGVNDSADLLDWAHQMLRDWGSLRERPDLPR